MPPVRQPCFVRDGGYRARCCAAGISTPYALAKSPVDYARRGDPEIARSRCATRAAVAGCRLRSVEVSCVPTRPESRRWLPATRTSR
jgi:hypothetical protein